MAVDIPWTAFVNGYYIWTLETWKQFVFSDGLLSLTCPSPGQPNVMSMLKLWFSHMEKDEQKNCMFWNSEMAHFKDTYRNLDIICFFCYFLLSFLSNDFLSDIDSLWFSFFVYVYTLCFFFYNFSMGTILNKQQIIKRNNLWQIVLLRFQSLHKRGSKIHMCSKPISTSY